jgi:hypothetical protein
VLLAVACRAALHQHQRLVALWGWTRSPFNFWTMLGYLLLHILLQDCTFIFLEMWHGTLLRRSLNVFSWSAPLLLICDLQCLLLAHSLHTNST